MRASSRFNTDLSRCGGTPSHWERYASQRALCRYASVVRCAAVSSCHRAASAATALGISGYSCHLVHTDSGSDFRTLFEPQIIGPARAQRRTLPLLKVLFAKTALRTDANANAFANAGVRERLPSPPGLANKQRTNANSGCSPTLFVGVFANARH